MNTYTFFKKNGGWHVYLPIGTVSKPRKIDVDLVDGCDSMLNLLSDGTNTVTLILNREPFENAEELELLSSCQPFLEGGYYLLKEHDGRTINYKMWIADITKVVFGDVPEKFYVKRAIQD